MLNGKTEGRENAGHAATGKHVGHLRNDDPEETPSRFDSDAPRTSQTMRMSRAGERPEKGNQVKTRKGKMDDRAPRPRRDRRKASPRPALSGEASL